ncbi:MAG TPA: 16S rRNA (guanine(966)-N(2))-methyltransferase RsmD [Candidatus Bathyarchaeia archaeon]|nr:16S rRNA (guanine(966)-N(2))-methyltransferase RsmD [Candidatus Bathyarchaeia archaeon]
MKILTGEFKGRNFYMPAGIPPTKNMTRKAVFDLIGQDLTGLHFLDLFAGSGAMGLEAFSCGAQTVTFVERDPKCGEVIEQNLALFGLDKMSLDGRNAFLLQSDVFAAIKSFFNQKKRFDVVFFDPPYEEGMAKKTLKTLGAYDILHPNSFIIMECGEREGLPYLEHDFQVMTERKYGKSCLVIYQPKS